MQRLHTNKLQSLNEFENKQRESDFGWLLKSIEQVKLRIDLNKSGVQALCEVRYSLEHCKQDHKEKNMSCFCHFKSLPKVS